MLKVLKGETKWTDYQMPIFSQVKYIKKAEFSECQDENKKIIDYISKHQTATIVNNTNG